MGDYTGPAVRELGDGVAEIRLDRNPPGTKTTQLGHGFELVEIDGDYEPLFPVEREEAVEGGPPGYKTVTVELHRNPETGEPMMPKHRPRRRRQRKGEAPKPEPASLSPGQLREDVEKREAERTRRTIRERARAIRADLEAAILRAEADSLRKRSRESGQRTQAREQMRQAGAQLAEIKRKLGG